MNRCKIVGKERRGWRKWRKREQGKITVEASEGRVSMHKGVR